MQKVYTVDFLTKKKKVNEGEVPQYYVEHNHDAIIEPAVFDTVQKQISVRQTGTNRRSSASILSGRIKCGCCGSWYGPKVWHSNDKYRRVIWQCNHKFDGGEKCRTPHLEEETLKGLFVKAVNFLTTEKDEIAANFRMDEIVNTISGKKEKKEQIERFLAELERQCGVVTQFDEEQWYSLVDFVTVFNKEDIRFTFKDGTEIQV